MEKKCYLLKDGKRVDDTLYTREDLLAKLNEIMKKENLSEDAINKMYDYQEVNEGGVSTEENTAGTPKEGTDEFSSQESNNDKYGFTEENDVYQASVKDDADGWNRILDNLDQIPDNIASLVDSHKDQLAIIEGKKGANAIKKNAIRVLYLYNEFMKFYNAYCSADGELPAPLAAYLRTRNTKLGFTDVLLGGIPRAIYKKVKAETTMDAVKKDMPDIIEDMFEAFDDYYKSDDPSSEIEEFYDEIKDFDEEIENIHDCIGTLSGTGNKFARMMAEQDDDFNRFCGGNPTGDALSKYLMDIAVKKYHLTRIKMDSKDPDSTLGALDWSSPEDKASSNVRLSENIDDYLNLKHAKILDSEADKKQVQAIVNEFKNGKKDQKTAQAEINRLVKTARDKMIASLKLFFNFMGITDTNKMNQFTSGLKRLDEPEYQNNWRSLVKHYKEAMEKKIEMFKKAHSSDMTKEDLDVCVNILDGLLKNADVMLQDVESKNGTQLMAHSREICDRIKEVKEKTAAAQKAFPKQ